MQQLGVIEGSRCNMREYLDGDSDWFRIILLFSGSSSLCFLDSLLCLVLLLLDLSHLLLQLFLHTCSWTEIVEHHALVRASYAHRSGLRCLNGYQGRVRGQATVEC